MATSGVHKKKNRQIDIDTMWAEVTQQVNAANAARHAAWLFDQETTSILKLAHARRDRVTAFGEDTRRMIASIEANYTEIANQAAEAMRKCVEDVDKARAIAVDAHRDAAQVVDMASKKMRLEDDEVSAVIGLCDLRDAARTSRK